MNSRLYIGVGRRSSVVPIQRTDMRAPLDVFIVAIVFALSFKFLGAFFERMGADAWDSLKAALKKLVSIRQEHKVSTPTNVLLIRIKLLDIDTEIDVTLELPSPFENLTEEELGQLIRLLVKSLNENSEELGRLCVEGRVYANAVISLRQKSMKLVISKKEFFKVAELQETFQE